MANTSELSSTFPISEVFPLNVSVKDVYGDSWVGGVACEIGLPILMKSNWY